MAPVPSKDVDASLVDAAVRSGVMTPAPGATPALLDFLKYSPSQPRAPKGTPTGGQWVAGDGGSGSFDPLDLKGDFNPGGYEGRRAYLPGRGGPPVKVVDDYLNVQGVDDDTVAAVRDAFEGEWGGLRSQVTGIYGTADGGNIHVVGIVLDEDDEQVGEFIRDIFPETKEVSHQSLFLSSQVQDRGFAKGFLSQTEAHYRAQGMEKILLMASDAVGGYAWAKAGFDFADGIPPIHVRESMEMFVESFPDHWATPTVEKWVNGEADWPSAYEIATLGEGSDDFEHDTWDAGVKMVHAGAYIMLGTEWAGEKDLTAVRKHIHLDDLSDEDWAWIERAIARGLVVKYDPNQPRDELGRWTSMGGSARGVIHGAKPEWSPTMTREDAEHWASDSVIQQVLTHTTAREHLSYFETDMSEGGWMEYVGGQGWVNVGAPAGILDVGFRSGNGIFGDGFYLGSEALEIVEEETGGRLVVPEIVDRQAKQYGYSGNRDTAPTLRVKVDVRKPFVMEVTTSDSHKGAVVEEFVRRHPDLAHTTVGTDPSTFLQRQGYDALVIHHDGPFEWQVGGDQVVLWDKTKATVIVDESGQPEDYRYRKMALDPLGLVAKYSASQPRHPKGSPRGGQWSGGSGGTGSFMPSRWESMTLDEQIAYATSEANPYQTGRVIGGDTRSGDFRAEVDPRRRFTELWQRTYEGYGAVRDATSNVLEGKDPLHEYVPPSFPHLSGDQFKGYTYGHEDMEQDVESAAKWFADGLRNAKPGERLYRGSSIPKDVLRSWGWGAGGDRVTLGPTSTSPDPEVAERYRSHSDGVPVVFRFDGSTKRFDLRYSDWERDHPESVVMGEFEVTDVYYDNEREQAWVDLRPVSQP